MDRILLLPGDGIGPSIIDSAERVLREATDGVEVIRGDIGFGAYERTGEFLPADTLDLVRGCGSVICGPVKKLRDENGNLHDPIEDIKVRLDLYAVVRCFRTMANDLGVRGMETVLWASNTKLGQDITETRDMDGITISKYIRSSSYSRMMARALTDAEMSGCTSAVCVNRDDLFPDSSAMFTEAFDSLFDSNAFHTDHMNIQNWASKVIRDPLRYQYVICADLYSHVAAGILAGLTGGNHLSPIGYVGETGTLLVPGLYDTFTGIDPAYANPMSIMQAAAMALFGIGLKDEAGSIVNAVKEVCGEGGRTPDIGGTLTTSQFTDLVVSRI